MRFLSALLLLCCGWFGQDMGPVQTGGTLGSVTPPTSPSFLQYAYVAGNSSSDSSITSPSITIGPNELLVAYCRTYGSYTVPAVANYNNLSFTAIEGTATTSGDIGQLNYLYLGPSTPVTRSSFTCTSAASNAWTSMIVLEFSVPPVTLNTSASSADTTSSTSFTSGAITTTASPTMNILCATGANNEYSFSAGDIAGVTASIVGTDQSSLTSAGEAACEWNTSASAVSSASGTINSSGSWPWAGTLAAFTY